MTQPLLSVRNVTKHYKTTRALSQANLDVYPGEIFALLGPNGAGKTTLIGCICGLVANFEGTITVAEHDVVSDYRVTRRLIGLVPQELSYDVFFSIEDALRIQGGYFGVSMRSDRTLELLRAFSLEDKRSAMPRWLSGGMKRRLMICKALMHQPVLLFLDEPTAGVDVELREELWEYVRQLRDQGTTIVLTTHYIEEAEQLADRVGIIHKGQIHRVDTRESLMQELGQQTLELELSAPIPQKLLEELGASLPIERVGPRILHVPHNQNDGVIDKLLRILTQQTDLSIVSLESKKSSLEEIFIELIKDASSSNTSTP